MKIRKPTYLQALNGSIDRYQAALMLAKEGWWEEVEETINRSTKECLFCQRQGILLKENRHEASRPYGLPSWSFCMRCEVQNLCRRQEVFSTAREVLDGTLKPKKAREILSKVVAELIGKRERYLAKRRSKQKGKA